MSPSTTSSGLTAQDHEDIRQLLARYNLAIDLGQIENWVACFTPEGIFECIGLPEGAITGGRHQGTQALRSYAKGHYGQAKGTARHWNWNLIIEGDGDNATMTCYLNAYTAGQGKGKGKGAVLRATGIYQDELVRVDGRWLFKSRRVTIDPA